MQTDPITLNSQDFARRSQTGDDSVYAVAGLTAPHTRTLSIAHATQGKGDSVAKRILVRVDDSAADSQGTVKTLSAYNVLVVPEGDSHDAADVTSILADLSDFFVEVTNGPARLVKLLNGEP